MSVRHTPGPWKVYLAKTGFHVIGIGASDGMGITDGGFGVWGGGDAESLANATLIAASPELLSALVECVDALTADTIGTVDMDDPAWYRQVANAVATARAALAKAQPNPTEDNSK
jgi:hypothetical protein